MKGIIKALRQQDRSARYIVGRFKHLVPDYQSFFAVPVNDNMIVQRGDKGMREQYRSEWPDLHPVGALYWPHAQRIVASNRRVTPERIARIIGGVRRTT